MSVQKYRSAQTSTETPRQTEYRLFAEVTKSLLACRHAERRDRAYFEAIDWNRRMWLTLQMDLASDENGLPNELKAQIISLAIWVDRFSSRAMRGDAALDPLINVNRQIMEGLAAQA